MEKNEKNAAFFYKEQKRRKNVAFFWKERMPNPAEILDKIQIRPTPKNIYSISDTVEGTAPAIVLQRCDSPCRTVR